MVDGGHLEGRGHDATVNPDEALISFNQFMTMETFSLLDDEKMFRLHTNLTLKEV